jgi:predicted phosphodiesterase
VTAARRVAALYDIHGNLPALEAVLADVRREGVDLLVVGGDVVPGPMPHETLGMLRVLDIPAMFIRGNGDREVLTARQGAVPSTIPPQYREGIRWNAAQLDADDARVIAAWPPSLRIDVGGIGSVLFCHATPRNDTEIFTRRTPEDRLRPIFDGLGAPLAVCGHTHMQFDRMVGATRVMNAGSVGMPFADPGAYWLLLAPGVELRRTTYDVNRAAELIRGTSYPEAGNFAENCVVHPRTEAAMLELFSRAEL